MVRGALWAGLFAIAAVEVRRHRPALEHLLAQAHVHDDVSAKVVSVAAAACAALAALDLFGAIVHGAAWSRAARQERWLSDDRRALSVPPLASHLDALTVRIGLVASTVFLLVGVGLLGVYATVTSHPRPAAGWGVFLTVGGTVAFATRQRERRAIALSERGAAALAGEPARPGAPVRAPEHGPPVPPVRFEIFESAGDDSPRLHPLSERTNLFDRPPWRIVYLRVFATARRLPHLLVSPWREFGYVHYIRAADSVSRAEIKRAQAGGPVFISSASGMAAELTRLEQQRAPVPAAQRHRWSPPPRAGDRVVFPVRALLCHTTFWRTALDSLLARADVALLDLSGYQQANTGTAYELQRVVDTFPVQRCAVLLDHRSDLLFLTAQIRHAWLRMDPMSPNRRVATGVVLLVIVPDDVVAGIDDPRPHHRRDRAGVTRVQYPSRQLTQTRAQFVRLGRRFQDVLDCRDR